MDTYWLIERIVFHEPMWVGIADYNRDIDLGEYPWTCDPHRALKFYSYEEAKAFLDFLQLRDYREGNIVSYSFTFNYLPNGATTQDDEWASPKPNDTK